MQGIEEESKIDGDYVQIEGMKTSILHGHGPFYIVSIN